MEIKINNIQLEFGDGHVNGFIIMPSELKSKTYGLFTHGYTSHKGSILNWCLRLAESGVSSVLFDLPGHYLGTFSQVKSFDYFINETPKLFVTAKNELNKHIEESFGPQELSSWNQILAGHSLGALFCLLSCEQKQLQEFNEQYIACVGFGLPPKGITHVFDTPFYKATIDIRKQLVHPSIPPEKVFPWIKQQKETLSVTGRNIILLTGQDDVVVGKDGSELLAQLLQTKGNQVQLEKPLKLAHHLPDMAAPHLKKIFKDLDFFI